MACLASLDSMLNGNDNNLMNTTLELPDALASEIKRRAALEGRKLDDVIADMLRAGMAPATNAEAANGQLVTKNLPTINVRPIQPDETPGECIWLDIPPSPLARVLSVSRSASQLSMPVHISDSDLKPE